MKIAILGATSHIAKNLIYFFLQDPQYELFLFARNIEMTWKFIKANKCQSVPHILRFDEFTNSNYCTVINCIGIVDSIIQQEAGVELFLITEHFDNLVINYLKSHSNTVYINFSSGAVCGTSFSSSATKNSIAEISVNNIMPKDFYRIAKLNAEAKHRAMKGYNIIDIRIFSFFSRFIDLDTGFLLCEMIKCVKNHATFYTSAVEIVRDYVAPKDLFIFIELCMAQRILNCSFDIYSTKPILKSELLNLFKDEFGLTIVKDENNRISNTGEKYMYYSCNYDANEKLSYIPTNKSIDVIRIEANMIINQR